MLTMAHTAQRTDPQSAGTSSSLINDQNILIIQKYAYCANVKYVQRFASY